MKIDTAEISALLIEARDKFRESSVALKAAHDLIYDNYKATKNRVLHAMVIEADSLDGIDREIQLNTLNKLAAGLRSLEAGEPATTLICSACHATVGTCDHDAEVLVKEIYIRIR